MAASLLHTPEGVRDIYDRECARKLAIQEKISHIFHLYGYEDIETPTFEYFDIFNKERGSVTSQEMFKFFDRDNNTLVLRPDMTPAIARCVGKYFFEETVPVRLCYRERTFTNNSSYQGRQKEITQTGVELIGDDASTADAEVIAMVIEALKASGLKEFQVELGQVEFFRGLTEEAGMDQETRETLRELIENKNYFGVEELISRQRISDSLGTMFLRLPELFGTLDQLGQVKAMVTNERSRKAIERLEKIQAILESYGLADYVSYDLGMLSKYQYYTGIIFKAYTYGTGEYIVNGGRYDKLLVQFGKDVPAVGFAIIIDQLMLALARQKVEIAAEPTAAMVLYDPRVQEQAVKMARELRNQQKKTVLIRKSSKISLTEYKNFALRKEFQQALWLKEDKSIVSLLEGGAL
ncbi:MAG: ATP phosphoribosyltransferase regulatory subunit [Hungatella sp.]|jgi:ATP phosphoribosyltransferase regulatory subunit|nr:ATP phosphoribosyltransferase regulatory subunit [Hungatella sp.]MCI9635357.1 ATP phosphoribosyltransferase regulatory subunit [Hungatella sp.]